MSLAPLLCRLMLDIELHVLPDDQLLGTLLAFPIRLRASALQIRANIVYGRAGISSGYLPIHPRRSVAIPTMTKL